MKQGRSTINDGLANKLNFYVLNQWNKLELYFLTHFKWFWNLFQSIRFLRTRMSKLLINRAIYKIPTRPHQFSTMADYTSWDSLTDRTYSGLHMKPLKERQIEPPITEIAKSLFHRREEKAIPSSKSTLLFAYFAQWFTDGFIRSGRDEKDPEFRSLKTTSNHHIDLCQLYGLTKEVTDALRDKKGGKGKLISQEINDEEYPPYYYHPPCYYRQDDGTFKIDSKFKINEEFVRKDQAGNIIKDDKGEPIPVVPRPLTFNNITEYQKYLDRLPEQDKEFFHQIVESIFPEGVKVAEEKFDRELRSKLFAMGVERANNQLGYIMMNTLFLREHNRICDELAKSDECKGWDDERLFQTARNILIVLVLKIVAEEYINHITPYHFKFTLEEPKLFSKEKWYRQNWMTVEFSLVYRWHSLMPDEVRIGEEDYPIRKILCNTKLLTDRGLAAWFEAASLQPAGEIGLFNTPMSLLITDWMSIKLNRDVRLPSYNKYREFCGFPPVTDFDQITGNKEIQQKLKDLYNDVNNIDFYVGLYAEDTRPNSALPPLIARLVGIDAFSQALTNPLLAENIFNEDTFSKVGMEIIQKTKSLSDILHRNIPQKDKTFKVTMTLNKVEINERLIKNEPLPGEEEDTKKLIELTKYFHEKQRKKLDEFRRGQHAQGTGFVRAKFIVNSQIPKWARVGVFSEPQKTYDALIRFSNEGLARGMAIKLLNVEGEPVLHPEEMINSRNKMHQDFLMTNHPSFPFPNVRFYRHFFELMKLFRFLPESETLAKLFFFKIQHRELGKIANAIRKKAHDVTNPLDLDYWSMSSYRLGANAIKFAARSKANNNCKHPDETKGSLFQALKERLEKEEVCFDFMIQGRIESHTNEMPIEDLSKEWPESLCDAEANAEKPSSSRFEPVAEIIIPRAEDNDIRKDCENEIFSPWNALKEHEPLGGINRLRRAVYHSSAYRRLHSN